MNSSLFAIRYCYLLAVAVMLLNYRGHAQCSGCTTTHASNSAANITIGSGQVVCVNSGVTLSGQVTLNGGTLCNSGTVNNLRLNSGSGRINNYGTIKDLETSITLTGNVSIYAYTASQFSFTTGGVSVNGTFDSLYFNVTGTGKVSFVNSLSMGAKKLSISNNSLFNIGGNLNLDNTALRLTNGTGAIVNVSGSINLTNTTNRTISNSGTLNIYNSLNIGGNGASLAAVTVNNSSYLMIVKNYESTMTNATINLNNTQPSAQGIQIGDDLLLTSTPNVLTNAGIVAVGRDISSKGTLSNSRGLSCANNFSISQGVFTNGNTAYLDVANDLRNSATMSLATSSFMKLKNYYHEGGSITGPSNPNGLSEYANILITAFSRNTSTITGYIMVNDTSLVPTEANRGVGFDDVVNRNLIGNEIVFAKKSIGYGNPIVKFCAGLQGQYNMTANSDQVGTTDYGGPVGLSAQFNQVSFAIGPFGPYYLPVANPSSTYTWQPTNQAAQNVTVTPPSSQVFTVNTYYLGCAYTTTVLVTVRELIYGVLSRDLNGGFQVPLSNTKLYFKYDEEYRNNTVLNYKIYKPDRTLLTTCTFNALQSNYGDNRFSISLPPCIPSPTSQYYTLEVQNEKKELFYLKFKY